MCNSIRLWYTIFVWYRQTELKMVQVMNDDKLVDCYISLQHIRFMAAACLATDFSSFFLSRFLCFANFFLNCNKLTVYLCPYIKE